MNPYRARVLWASLLATAVVSCSEPLAPAVPGKLLFEIEVTSSGLGLFWRGYSVDAEGHVYAWDVFAAGASELRPSDSNVFTGEQLQAKYAHGRTLVATLPAGEAESRYAEVGAALRGRLTGIKMGCPDVAFERYYALVYDPAGDRYTRVLLHQSGAAGRANTSPAARDLYHWLVKVTTGGEVSGPSVCDPYGG
ncbi:MAG: hypothetical protein ACJ8GN_22680 [Longimicrobiaceae bacterium]